MSAVHILRFLIFKFENKFFLSRLNFKFVQSRRRYSNNRIYSNFKFVTNGSDQRRIRLLQLPFQFRQNVFFLSFKKASFEFEVHLRLTHMSKIIHSKSVTCLMYRVNCKMIIQVYFNGDFTRRNILPAAGFRPDISSVAFCLGITFLTKICISLIDHFSPIPR